MPVTKLICKRSPGSTNERASDIALLPLPDQVRRLGVDAELRDHRAQLQVFATALHSVRQLCVKVSSTKCTDYHNTGVIYEGFTESKEVDQIAHLFLEQRFLKGALRFCGRITASSES